MKNMSRDSDPAAMGETESCELNRGDPAEQDRGSATGVCSEGQCYEGQVQRRRPERDMTCSETKIMMGEKRKQKPRELADLTASNWRWDRAHHEGKIK
jgi:hypothetical protein